MFIKYLKREHLQSAVELGEVKIGTFHEYQRTEAEDLRDADEGQARVRLCFPEGDSTLSAAEMTAAMQTDWGIAEPFRIKFPGGIDIVFTGQDRGRGFNAFVFSLTEADAPSAELMADFGYDAAYEVEDIKQFISVLTLALDQVREKIGIDPEGWSFEGRMDSVEYVEAKEEVIDPDERDRPVSGRIDGRSFWKKSIRFQKESEFRLVFLPINESHEYDHLRSDGGVILRVGDALGSLVSPVEFP